MTSARELRVFFDHGHQWPPWEAGDKVAMEPSDYGFSPELTALLRRWHDAWEPIADFDIGQTDEPPAPGSRAALEALAHQALAAIHAEIPLDVTVDVSLAIS
jgi:hypothetical protein